MATKWKNRLVFMTAIILFTFGIKGLLAGMSMSSEYLLKDYAQTRQFHSRLNDFISYLNTFELQYVSAEEMKQKITVTAEEIDEHRYRYGDLPEQIDSIKSQYEDKIVAAKQAGLEGVAEIYAAQRDAKIEDITSNFTSDDHVRLKIIKEKEQQIEAHYQELEKERPVYERLKKDFQYYLKDTATGQVYTNIVAASEAEAAKVMHSDKMLALISYPVGAKEGYDGERSFTGLIGVPKTASMTGPMQLNYKNYQQKQIFYGGLILSGLLALITSMFIYKKMPVAKLIEAEGWERAYNRLPLDIGVVGFIVTCFITLLMPIDNMYVHGRLKDFLPDLITGLLITACFLALTIIQGKLLAQRIKDWDSFKKEWQAGVIYRTYQNIKEAFLIKSIGTKVLLILTLAFAFGAGAIIVLLEPELILLYVPGFLIVGLPVLIAIMKRAGYFNRIVASTEALVAGNLEPNLPVQGKGTLALLASNINILKHGVKTSRREQAKSERLKTELITNVSHDLRTPLTSIITYTELLKKPDLAAEDREAYIQIIDRKAGRLKVLIDDLFEASKMASGSIKLVKEKVDVVQLLEQALAEHEKAISGSSLQFRVTKPAQPIYTVVDGQKIWRVFDNLLGNILKYALEDTRVYISVEAAQGKATIIFKNVTKYELGQNIEELFERFKRGDTSRHTEGSGLGLAIAKSIIDLHEGSLDIEIDGDLFKVIVKLDAVFD